jgi:hypothetical protein
MGVCVSSSFAGAGGAGSPPHFSFSSRDLSAGTGMCTPERLSIGYVQVNNYASALPAQYRYYASSVTGGPASPITMDFCPAVTGYSNRRCTNAGDAPSQTALFGEAYGATSRCFDTNLRTTAASTQGYIGNGGGCHPFACSGFGTPGATLTVTVVASPANLTITCGPGSKGAARTVTGFAGTLTCPDPLALCSPAIGYTPPPAVNTSAGGGASDAGAATAGVSVGAIAGAAVAAIVVVAVGCGLAHVCCGGGSVKSPPAPPVAFASSAPPAYPAYAGTPQETALQYGSTPYAVPAYYPGPAGGAAAAAYPGAAPPPGAYAYPVGGASQGFYPPPTGFAPQQPGGGAYGGGGATYVGAAPVYTDPSPQRDYGESRPAEGAKKSRV